MKKEIEKTEEEKSEPAKKSIEDHSVIKLKAKVYDLMAQAEAYQRAIQEIQKQIGEINQEIIKENKNQVLA